MKISYSAYKRGFSVAELFFQSIMECYNMRLKLGLIKNPWPEAYNSWFFDLLKGRADLKLTIWYNNKDLL